MCRGHKTINKTVCKVKFKINKNLEDKIEYPPKGSMLDHDDVYVLTSDIVVVCTTIYLLYAIHTYDLVVLNFVQNDFFVLLPVSVPK